MSELGDLVELLGADAALKLIEAHGGTRIGVPKEKPVDGHALQDLLGDAGFALLFQYFGGNELVIPMARHWRFEIYSKRGMRPKEIARRAQCTEAAFYAWRAKQRDARQMQLPFLLAQS